MNSIVGLVVEFVVAIDEARVRFTDDAFFFSFAGIDLTVISALFNIVVDFYLSSKHWDNKLMHSVPPCRMSN